MERRRMGATARSRFRDFLIEVEVEFFPFPFWDDKHFFASSSFAFLLSIQISRVDCERRETPKTRALSSGAWIPTSQLLRWRLAFPATA